MPNFNRAFTLEVENHSNQRLRVHEKKIRHGRITKPLVPINPGTKEAIAGRRRVLTTGPWGTVSWLIGDTGKMLVIMYNVPYYRNGFANTLAVGIFDQGSTDNFYEKMYKDAENSFKRKEFAEKRSYDVLPLFFVAEDSPFGIRATMDKAKKAKIRVQLYPTTVRGLATTLKPIGIRKTRRY